MPPLLERFGGNPRADAASPNAGRSAPSRRLR